MPQHQLILQAQGPLPITTTFISTGSSQSSDFFVSGTAYTTSTNVPVTIDVFLDGQLIGSAGVFANEIDSHRSVVSTFSQVPTLSKGSHKLTLQGSDTTVTDGNDWFAVTLLY